LPSRRGAKVRAVPIVSKPEQLKRDKPKLVLRPGKSGRIRPSWRVNQTRLFSFPVTRQSISYRDQLNVKGNKFARSVVRSSSTTRWAIALVERIGPNDFDILERSVVTYEKPNPGQLILNKLAVEFDFRNFSGKLLKIDPRELA